MNPLPPRQTLHDAGAPVTRRPPSARRGLRATLAGVVVSSALGAVKIVSGVAGNSYALIADGIESILDIISSLVVWGSLKIASRPADSNHPYGHGKAEPLGAMVIAIALLGAAAGIAIQSAREIITPHHAPAPFTLAVLVAVVIAKEILFRFLARTGAAIGSTAMQTDAWHHRSDALTSAAAFIGISIALTAGEGFESADDWAALAACGIISFNGIRLFRSALAEVMDSAPPPAVRKRICALAGAVPGVEEIETCRVRKSGTTYLVDIHAVVDGDLTVRRGHEIAHEIKDALLESDPAILDVLVHIEPAECPRRDSAEP